MNSTAELTKNWLQDPKDSARRLVDYYGQPHEMSKNMLVWYNTHDGWKRTVLVNQEIPHSFPSPHHDFLEQFIDYRVPVEKFTELADYDGSVIVERTKGEMSARCGGTSMNFVAINLAHDIVTDNISVEEAREQYACLYQAYKDGENPVYAQYFQFGLIQGRTADPDVSII